MADDAIAVATYIFPGSRYILMGISMGGMIAQTIVTSQPQLVDRLILVITSFLLYTSHRLLGVD
jgi:alpha-beta hydrolase superfamily lysophospholipase